MLGSSFSSGLRLTRTGTDNTGSAIAPVSKTICGWDCGKSSCGRCSQPASKNPSSMVVVAKIR